jgi:uncharacterized protein YdeI (YjbR/CyaY-like superfamily)
MAVRKSDTKPSYFATGAEFRKWLEKNHETEKELLVGFHKRSSGTPSMTWSESVDEALCFGWIDGVRRSLGEDCYTIRFTPRKPTSIWSAINVAKIGELTKLGKMRPAGLRAFARRTAAKTGVYSFERKEAAVLPPEQEKALRANREAARFFDAQAPWYRRTAIHWVISARREETRERRLKQLIADSAAGRTIGPLTRPERKSAIPGNAPRPRTDGAGAANTAKGTSRTRKARTAHGR